MIRAVSIRFGIDYNNTDIVDIIIYGKEDGTL